MIIAIFFGWYQFGSISSTTHRINRTIQLDTSKPLWIVLDLLICWTEYFARRHPRNFIRFFLSTLVCFQEPIDFLLANSTMNVPASKPPISWECWEISSPYHFSWLPFNPIEKTLSETAEDSNWRTLRKCDRNTTLGVILKTVLTIRN